MMVESGQLLVAHEWEPCGEGARNVVLRYTGNQAPLVRTPRLAAPCREQPSSPGAPASRQQVGHVLRLPKGLASLPSACSDAAHACLERQLWGHIPDYASAVHHAHRSWLFAAHVLVPLLGERAAAAGKLVTAPAEFVQAVSRAVGVAVDTDEVGRCVGALLPDHAHFSVRASGATPPVVTVELKPKCGFLPQVLSAQQCAKRAVSRFAMHQLLKLKDGHVSKARAWRLSALEACALSLHVRR